MQTQPLLKIRAIGAPRSGQWFCVPELPPIGSFFWIPICDPLLPFRGKWWYELGTHDGQPVYRFVGRKLPAHVAYVGRKLPAHVAYVGRKLPAHVPYAGRN